MKNNIYSIGIKQSLTIIVLSVFISLVFNFFRSAPLPIVGKWDVESRLTTDAGKSMVISFDDAVSLFEQNAAVFVDARNVDQYEYGHIKGAISLPWHDLQERFMDVLPEIDPDMPVVTYCDGESCSLSHDLALFFKDMGFQVYVLVNGWSVWKAGSMPVEVKAQ
ncbi:Rhodanese-like protein [Desulfamplus magnetovallimortis]|uniref:Rhodanese-like protein n=1 Tax=Desulfamplus magnetovallimortis TaxID=1246637 RepID=A0A1W1HJF3_9BACT|nr:rhodanese-like domain-containing protein [Desulfamplus magnetovallimortis]SLM32599.1 Rhodanese-like protein [Desulfamplus magnetovallimortis]